MPKDFNRSMMIMLWLVRVAFRVRDEVGVIVVWIVRLARSGVIVVVVVIVMSLCCS